MKIRYDKEADALYIDLLDLSYMESEEIAPGIIVDYSKDGRIVGIEVLNASQKLHEVSGLTEIKKVA